MLILAAPAATVLGAGLAFVGMWVGGRQRERADRRTEWRERFVIALGELADGSDPRRRTAGRAILRSLMESDLSSEEDRQLAAAVLSDELDDEVEQLPHRGPIDRDSLDDEVPSCDNDGTDSSEGGVA